MRGEEQRNVLGLPISSNVDSGPEPVRRPPSWNTGPPKPEIPPEQPDSLREYLGVVQRHKVVVLLLVPRRRTRRVRVLDQADSAL